MNDVKNFVKTNRPSFFQSYLMSAPITSPNIDRKRKLLFSNLLGSVGGGNFLVNNLLGNAACGGSSLTFEKKTMETEIG